MLLARWLSVFFEYLLSQLLLNAGLFHKIIQNDLSELLILELLPRRPVSLAEALRSRLGVLDLTDRDWPLEDYVDGTLVTRRWADHSFDVL